MVYMKVVLTDFSGDMLAPPRRVTTRNSNLYIYIHFLEDNSLNIYDNGV